MISDDIILYSTHAMHVNMMLRDLQRHLQTQLGMNLNLEKRKWSSLTETPHTRLGTLERIQFIPPQEPIKLLGTLGTLTGNWEPDLEHRKQKKR